ncbi:MAG: hypothetical protein RIB80_11490 [Rhodospirillales bacterium]
MDRALGFIIGIAVVGGTLALVAGGLVALLAVPLAFPLTLSAVAVAFICMAGWAYFRKRSTGNPGRHDARER